VGLGSIGRAIARRARAFEMTVLASRASAQAGDTDPDVDELFPADRLDDMIGSVDHLVLALPATPDSVGLIDARRLALMRPGSMLINIARGVHVVEADLIAALESGHLGAAALDVTHTEPLPADDPLWAAPNLYLSPHTSASLDRYQEQVISLAGDNARRLLDAQPLRNVVI
jgi:phosphoglycerate dehydrogenase-like enzyme